MFPQFHRDHDCAFFGLLAFSLALLWGSRGQVLGRAKPIHIITVLTHCYDYFIGLGERSCDLRLKSGWALTSG